MPLSIPAGRVVDVPIAKLRPDPDQPRKVIDKEALSGLTKSIKAIGVQQPLRVRLDKQGAVIVLGERRWRAAKAAGLKAVPCILADTQDSLQRGVAQLAENTEREQLSVMDTARFLAGMRRREKKSDNELFAALMKHGINADRARLETLIAITDLPEWAHKMISDGTLQETHAQALLPLLKVPPGRSDVGIDARARINSQLQWKRSVTVSEVRDIVRQAFRDKGHDLDIDHGPEKDIRAFSIDVCKGCKAFAQLGTLRVCFSRADFDRKNEVALKVKHEKEAAKAERDGRKAAPAAAPGAVRVSPGEQKQKAKRKAELLEQHAADYLEAWLRKRIAANLAKVELQPQGGVMLSLLLWMATGAVSRGAQSWGAGQRHEELARFSAVWLKERDLREVGDFLAMKGPGDLKPEQWQQLAAVAVAAMTQEQVRTFAKHLRITLTGDGYVIDRAYLDLHRKPALLELAKLAKVTDASGSVGDLKKKLLEPAAVKAIGIPKDMQKLYDAALQKGEKWGAIALPDDFDFGRPPEDDEDDMGAAVADLGAKKKGGK